MKVFVAVDMEGIAGIVQWDEAQRERQRRFMTEEANAAVRGAIAGGAIEVLVGESHGGYRHLLPELLDSRARHLAGQPKPMNHMGGVDDSFDLAMFVGYHAKAGTLHGVMAHTFSGSIYSLSFNGIEVGEIGADAALCGYHQVPVGLVTGDRAACEEARSLLGELKTVSVKEGVSRSAARCMSVSRAREMIEEAATEAVGRASNFKPFMIHGPVVTDITWVDPSYADTVEHLDFVTRIDGRTIRLETEDFISAFERFTALRFLAPVVR